MPRCGTPLEREIKPQSGQGGAQFSEHSNDLPQALQASVKFRNRLVPKSKEKTRCKKIVELKMHETRAIVGGAKIASVGPLGRLPPVVAGVVSLLA
jgi:hypothetical protein